MMGETSNEMAGNLAVSVEEAAYSASLGRTSIYEAIGSGALKSLKVGRRRLILVDDLQRWLRSHEVAR